MLNFTILEFDDLRKNEFESQIPQKPESHQRCERQWDVEIASYRNFLLRMSTLEMS